MMPSPDSLGAQAPGVSSRLVNMCLADLAALWWRIVHTDQAASEREQTITDWLQITMQVAIL